MATVCHLTDRFRALSEHADGSLSVGTFPGVDGGFRATGALSKTLAVGYGIDLEFTCSFTCTDSSIREAVATSPEHHLQPEFVFNAVKSLGDGGQVLNVLSGFTCEPPSVDIVLSSFEGDEFNHVTLSGDTVVCSSSNFEWSVAVCSLRYVKRCLPLLCVFECRRNLDGGRSVSEADIGKLTAVFNALGYIVKHLVGRANDYGCPQTRTRLYIFCALHSPSAPCQTNREFHLVEDFPAPKPMRVMMPLLEKLRIDPWDCEDFLLPDESPEIKTSHADRVYEFEQHKSKRHAADAQRHATDHILVFTDHRLDRSRYFIFILFLFFIFYFCFIFMFFIFYFNFKFNFNFNLFYFYFILFLFLFLFYFILFYFILFY